MGGKELFFPLEGIAYYVTAGKSIFLNYYEFKKLFEMVDLRFIVQKAKYKKLYNKLGTTALVQISTFTPLNDYKIGLDDRYPLRVFKGPNN